MEHDEVIQIVSEWFRSQRNVILVRKGRGEFPEPDVHIQYNNKKIAFVECKPSDADGREYLTGLGQAVAYTTLANFSYLAIPEKEMNMFKKFFVVDEIGLMSVIEAGDVKVIQKPRESRPSKIETRERSYGYYRDLKPLEIYEVLKTISKQDRANHIRDSIWNVLKQHRDLQSEKQKDAWLLNTYLLLRDLGLINSDWGLTRTGVTLLQFGHSNKELYVKELTRCFLINANYIDILTLIQELNNKQSGFSNVRKFKKVLEKAIIKEKLATPQTNVERDLQDVLRILRELDLITGWEKIGLAGRFNVNWKKIVPFLK
jgi:hypothetical protein